MPPVLLENKGLFFTKLRTGLSSNILKTPFGINRGFSISNIVKTVRKALLKDFFPHYMGFDHITRNEIIDKHTTIFARELLAFGNPNAAILLLDGTYIYMYIEKSKKKICFSTKIVQYVVL
mgnify:CR=1 FL=1